MDTDPPRSSALANSTEGFSDDWDAVVPAVDATTREGVLVSSVDLLVGVSVVEGVVVVSLAMC